MISRLQNKIQESVSAIASPTLFSVEFGAWDGIHLLNCRNLILHHGHRAVVIEADEKKYQQLRKNYPSGRGVECIKALVGWGPKDGLDFLLRATRCPTKPDFLSIDVDGTDYHIWEAIQIFRPTVVCIEFNPTIPREVEFVVDADPHIQHGSSMRSLSLLAEKKNYGLLHVDHHDLLFATKEYFDQAQKIPLSWQSAPMETQEQTHIFVGYNGRLLLRGAATLRWHGLRFYEEDIQALPNWLQKYPDNMNFFQKQAFQLLRLLRRWRASWRRRLGFSLRP